jgi:putative tryptophan/tyrosine transport system substrate-binding protein
MRRREFIALLGGTATYPFNLHAQPVLPIVGFVHGHSMAGEEHLVAMFQRSLQQRGYYEGRNVAIEYCWGAGQYERLPVFLADLIAKRAAVIVAVSGSAAVAKTTAGSTTPIVFMVGGDPVKLGLVTSINRPGGNLTGVSMLAPLLEPKRLELLRELVPHATTVGLVIDPQYADAQEQSLQVRAAGAALGLAVVIMPAHTQSEIVDAFAKLVQQRVDALLVGSSPNLFRQREQIVRMAMRHAIPAIYQWREYAADGGLVSYGSDLSEAYRLVADYFGRILSGEMPANLPVQQSVRRQLVINLQSAKTLGLDVPPSILARADEVIE